MFPGHCSETSITLSAPTEPRKDRKAKVKAQIHALVPPLCERAPIAVTHVERVQARYGKSLSDSYGGIAKSGFILKSRCSAQHRVKVPRSRLSEVKYPKRRVLLQSIGVATHAPKQGRRFIDSFHPNASFCCLFPARFHF